MKNAPEKSNQENEYARKWFEYLGEKYIKKMRVFDGKNRREGLFYFLSKKNNFLPRIICF